MLIIFFSIFNILVILLSTCLLDGVTQKFFERIMPISLICFLGAVLYPITIKFFWKTKEATIFHSKLIQKLPFRDLNYSLKDDYSFLIPLAIIFNYYLFNLINKEIALYSFFSELAIIIIPIACLVIIFNFFISNRFLKFNLKFNLLTFLIFIVSVPSLSSIFGWSEQASLRVALPLFCLIIIITFLLLTYQKLLLKIFSIAFSLSILSSLFVTNLYKPSYKSNNRLEQIFYNKEMKNKPNIYLLTYDSYVSNEVMGLYGIDNSKQEKFLKEEGFTFYNKAYTISTQSVFSIGRMLDLQKGNEHKAVAGKSFATKVLGKNGYKTFGIFRDRYFFNSQNNLDYYDMSFPKVQSTGILKALISGKFTWDINQIEGGYQYFLKKKSDVIMQKHKQPIFLYTHTGPFHSPKNGSCNSKWEINEYKIRLDTANIEMKRDVRRIKISDPNAIIIVNGDHGPFMLNKCGKLNSLKLSKKVDRPFLKDNFSSFLAISWPKNYNNPFPETNITILQDTFFEIFEYLFQSKEIYDYRLKPITDIKESGELIAGGVFVNNNKIIGGQFNDKNLFQKKTK